MTRREIILRALERCGHAMERYPGVPALESIRAQLIYLLDLEEGRTSDRSGIGRLTLGILTVREVEDRDPELAEFIYQLLDVL